MLEELRISSLGVIDESVLELGPGFTAITGETGAGKTMVVTALGLLLGGRADSGAVRTGATVGPRRGPGPRGLAGARRRRRRGRRRGRGRPAGAGPADLRRGPVPRVRRRRRGPGLHAVARWPTRWSRCTASPTSTGCCARPRSATRSTASPAPKALRLRARFGERYAALRATEAELADVVESARERAREADLLRFGLGEIEEVDPQPGEDVALAARGGPARLRGHAAHRRRAGPRVPVRRGRRSRRARHGLRGPQAARRGARARPRGGRAGRPARRDQLPALRRGRRRGVVRQRPGHRPGPAGRGLRTPRGAGRADPQVRRDDRRRAGLVGAARPSGCSSSTTPTSGSSS